MPRHIRNIDWIIKNKMEFLSKFGMSESNIRTNYDQWQKQHQGTTANDYLWHIFHQILNSINKQVFEDLRRYDLFLMYISKCGCLKRKNERTGTSVLNYTWNQNFVLVN
jgi:hypothetical protein